MDMFNIKGIFILLVALLLTPLFAADNEIEQLIQAVCQGAKDDADRAARLVSAAAEIHDAPKARNLFYERAVDYGMKTPAGYKHAEKALAALEKFLPDRANEWRSKRMLILRREYQTARGTEKMDAGRTLVERLVKDGDDLLAEGQATDAIKAYQEAIPIAAYLKLPARQEILDKVKEARKRMAAEKEILALKAAIEKNPKDVKSRTKLINYYMLELDKPEQAVKYLNDDIDLELGVIVPKAAKEIDQIDPAECGELGNWYYKHRDSVSTAGKMIVMERSLGYFERYLAEGKPQGVKLLKTKLQINNIGKELEKLGGSTLPKGAVQVITFDKNTIGRQGEGYFARDLSGKNVNAIIVGGTLAPGIAGEAVSLSGSKQYVDTRFPHTPAPKTVVLWAKCNRTRAMSVMLFGHMSREPNGNRFYLAYQSSTGNLCLGLGMKAWKNETSIHSDLKWHHYALVWNGKTMGLYYDAKPVATKSDSIFTRGRYYLGAMHEDGDVAKQYWPGLIDEYAIFNRVLTPAEIKKIYDLGKSGKSLKR